MIEKKSIEILTRCYYDKFSGYPDEYFQDVERNKVRSSRDGSSNSFVLINSFVFASQIYYNFLLLLALSSQLLLLARARACQSWQNKLLLLCQVVFTRHGKPEIFFFAVSFWNFSKVGAGMKELYALCSGTSSL